MKATLCRWLPRMYSMMRLMSGIRLEMFIITRERVQMTPVSSWLHGKLEMCGNLCAVLTT